MVKILKMKLCTGVLTSRQRQVFRMYKSGKGPTSIAEKLGISKQGASQAVNTCLEKLYKFYYNIDRYREIIKNNRTKLTPQELKVLKLWKVEGRLDKNICKKLNIKRVTLKKYRAKIRKKVNEDEIESAVLDNNKFDNSDSFESFSFESTDFSN